MECTANEYPHWITVEDCDSPQCMGGKSTPAHAADVRDQGSIPGLGRSPGGGNGNPTRCLDLENPMDGGAWQATAHGVAKSRTRRSNLAQSACEAAGCPIRTRRATGVISGGERAFR